MTETQSGTPIPGHAAAWDAWYNADHSARTIEQDFNESKYDAMRRAFLAGAQAASAAAAPAGPQPDAEQWAGSGYEKHLDQVFAPVRGEVERLRAELGNAKTSAPGADGSVTDCGFDASGGAR